MYVAWDRPDIQYATMTASKGAAHPTVLDMMKVKRVARYLVHRQHLCWVYTVRTFSGHIEVYTDSDWGGDQKTRRSTSGVILCFEGCIIDYALGQNFSPWLRYLQPKQNTWP